MSSAAGAQPFRYAGLQKKREKKKEKEKEKERERESRAKESTKSKYKSKDRNKKDKENKKEGIDAAHIMDNATNIRVGDYQMLEAIGKGGCGVVYRGLNVKTGTTVAVKRVSLQGIPKEELEGIEMEIKLLRNLSHPNIVKYVDAIRTHDHLNIMIEFVENGSLSALLGRLIKGGQIEEHLVAVYTIQILEGLKYLHQQGVVHRDIKGANILTTKNGVVKLADFGVATRINDNKKSDSVVGTPYWMAPEIIEMTGQQSSACDIWSVGCTVVELLTGKPPYFDLQQMQALFRIVQDEHPPLPDNISDALEDFLMQCFQKDPLRRVTATDLLKHPWLRIAQVNRPPIVDDREIKDEKKETSINLLSPTSEPAQHRESLGDDDFDLDIDDEDEDDNNNNQSKSKNNQLKLPKSPAAHQKSAPTRAKRADSALGAAPIQQTQKFIETEDDANFDLDDNEEISLDVNVKKKLKFLETQAKNESAPDREEDVFADLDFDAPDPRSDQDAKVNKQFMKLLSLLTPKESESTVIEACQQLKDMIVQNREVVTELMTTRGVIPIMEMLEVPSPPIIVAVLDIVNLLIGSEQNQKFQQNMSMVGLIPAIIRFASPGFPTEIRLGAANFVRHFCYSSDYTRKMYTTCGGLPVLVGFLEENYEESKTLVFNSIDCIRHILEITSNPKNDFYRLFCKYGLLPPLAQALIHVNADRIHPDAPEYTRKMAQLFYRFSEGDATVKSYMAKAQVMEGILKSLNLFSHEVLSYILKSIRSISMEVSTLDLLESAGAITALIPFLNSPHADIQNQVLLSMYSLSTINPSRQEQAASSGIIPHLQRYIRANHPLKQFALPIMFQLAKTSKRTRLELKKYNGVGFFLDQLKTKENYWTPHALEALAIWLTDDPRRVEFVLTRSSNIHTLIGVLKNTKSMQFDKILVPFHRILSASPAVNQALGRSGAFVEELVNRLTVHADSNNIRMNIIKILSLLNNEPSSKADLIRVPNLLNVLKQVANEQSAVMVAPLARDLVCKLDPNAAAQLLPLSVTSPTSSEQQPSA